ncbi:MAG: DegT/DnrJ/EryC1/StrS family aminotransferase [Deltaproteobacteria bacterium]|nr:DegT/DnrJ/EryC1/StrS family aminotransferase [Deltaproteobacteria bacterium]
MSTRRIEFHRHALNEEDIAEVTRVLHTLFLTSGPVGKRFENDLADYLGVAESVAVSSCTTGMFLCLKAMGIGPGDEVITTPMTFIATSNVIIHAGAKPVFVDCEPDTGLIDASAIEGAITDRTKAIMPVHLLGQMADMRAICGTADKHGLRVIEDSAHGPECSRDGNRPGTAGDAAVLSFYATKPLTCGEGGAIAVRDAELADELRKLRLHGMSKSAADRYHKAYVHWDMELLGYKANLPDILAALLVHQLGRIDGQREARERIARRYEAGLANIPGLELAAMRAESISTRHLFPIWVPAEHRDQTLVRLQELGVGVAVNYRAVHLLSFYRERYGFERGMFPNAESIGDRTISLPIYPALDDEQVDAVIDAVRTASELWQ